MNKDIDQSSKHRYAVVVNDNRDDPNAHKLWQALMADFQAELGLRHKEQIGVLSFAELTDIFYYKTGEIHLHHDADPGDITISASASNLLDEFVGELIKLDRYKINY